MQWKILIYYIVHVMPVMPECLCAVFLYLYPHTPLSRPSVRTREGLAASLFPVFHHSHFPEVAAQGASLATFVWLLAIPPAGGTRSRRWRDPLAFFRS